jgi:arginase family enzyme
VKRSSGQKVVLFGCPLDCDEKHDAIQEKLAAYYEFPQSDDPVIPVAAALAVEVPGREWKQYDSIEVPGWLRPMPTAEERPKIVVDAFVAFIDQNGCREFADRIAKEVRSKILPDFPCMIAVDHSLTGGAIEALTEYYGQKNISLLVVDSHTDAVPMSKLAKAIAYDVDTNPDSVYDKADPFLFNRPESYNASSFLHHLVADNLVDPRDLYILGVSDYPEKKALRIKDPRITDYTSAYADLKKQGATIVTKRECQLKPTKVKALLKKIRTPFAYISIDMDIGARNALNGVRFRNWQGLSETQIYRLVDTICQAGKSEVQIVGMDITEINSRIAGRQWGESVDRTYQIAASLVKRIAFGRAIG